jgi:hypothetical protein
MIGIQNTGFRNNIERLVDVRNKQILKGFDDGV